MSKKELKYRIEALEDEVEDLEIQLQEKHERLWEVIQENDRLTMTYEPYRPEDDEHADKDFYGLIEENEKLERRVRQLATEKARLRDELESLKDAMVEMKPQKARKVGVLSLDFWPPSDWVRFKYDKWDPGMYSQVCIGPLRLDWFAD